VTSTAPGSMQRLSVPPKFAAPRPLTASEIATLRAIADVLVPATGDNPAATAEPDFDTWLMRAVNARADAFGAITSILAQLDGAAPAAIDRVLRGLNEEQPGQFQALSAVVVGAWLLVPTVRARIGYPGQRRDPARLEEAADQISDGILDPVIARGPIYTPDGTTAPSTDRS
jgi:hypothetical protein